MWKSQHVIKVVRMCESTTYPADKLPPELPIMELMSKDGDVPVDEDINKWLALVTETYGTPAEAKKKPKNEDGDAIAVHCVAGLGRSPLLVAVALMEYGCEGGKALQVIEYVRARRRKALNKPQLDFLKSYKPRLSKDCIIM